MTGACWLGASRFNSLPLAVVMGLALLAVADGQSAKTPPPLSSEARMRIGQLREQIREHRYAAEYPKAAELAREVAEIREREQGASWWETTDAVRTQRHLERIAARPKSAQASLAATERTDVDAFRLHQERQFDEAIALLEARVRASRAQLGDSQEAADILQGLASVYRNAGRLEQALVANRQVLEMLEGSVEAGHPRILNATGNVGNDLRALGRLRDARPYLKRAHEETLRLLGPGHGAVRSATDNYGMFLIEAGQYTAAEELARESVRLAHENFGADHDHAVRARTVLAAALRAQGKIDEVEPLIRITFESNSQLLGWSHPSTWAVATELGRLCRELGRYDEALDLFTRVRDAQRIADDPTATRLADAMGWVGVTLADLKRWDEARAVLGRAEELAVRQHDMNAALRVGAALAEVMIRSRSTDARSNYAQTLSERAARLPRQHVLVRDAQRVRAAWYRATGLIDRAVPITRAAFEIERSPATYPRTVDAYLDYARGLVAGGDTDGAIEILGEALDRLDDSRSWSAALDPQSAPLRRRAASRAFSVAAAHTLVRAGSFELALHALERGRCREWIDRWSRAQPPHPGISAASAAEESARLALNDTVARRVALTGSEEPDRVERERLSGERAAAVAALVSAERATLGHMRHVWPAARAATASEVRAVLEADEHLFVYAVDGEMATLLSVPPSGTADVRGWVLASGADMDSWRQALLAARASYTDPASGAPPPSREQRASWLDLVVPPQARAHAEHGSRWLIVPDGPLAGLPIEALARAPGVDLPVTLVPSSTLLREVRARAPASSSDALVVVGNPKIRAASLGPEPPPGVVVRRIEPGLNAHAAGLRVGDVVTGYARVEIRSLDDFDAAIRRVNRERSTGELGSEAQLELSYWRAGEPHRTSVKVGRLGVRFDPGPSGKALAMHRRRAKLPTQALGEARRAAAHRVHDVDELHARTRVSVLGDAASAEEKTVLSGDRAGLAEIEKVMPGAVVHFACVAHAGTAHRASSANLVLTTPANPTARDYGFLDAQHLHGGRTPSPWPGTLVVLQRCVVETELTLQEGFLQAGANGVVTTLWTTDPVSSAFLFAEFYAALADRRTESVRRALSLARAKTRSATLADVCQRLAVTADEIARDLPRLGAAKATDRPFVHPHYWSGVVMVGR